LSRTGRRRRRVTLRRDLGRHVKRSVGCDRRGTGERCTGGWSRSGWGVSDAAGRVGGGAPGVYPEAVLERRCRPSGATDMPPLWG
jgi:hypothetical protein